MYLQRQQIPKMYWVPYDQDVYYDNIVVLPCPITDSLAHISRRTNDFEFQTNTNT